MKYSATTVMLPEYSMEEAAQMLSRLGFDGIEWRVHRIRENQKGKPFSPRGNVKNDLSPDNLLAQAEQLKRVSAEHGLTIAALASYPEADQLADVRLVAEGTARCGAPFFRVRIPGSVYNRTVNVNVLYERAVGAFGKACEIAREFGVRIIVETHNHTIVCSASAAYRLVSNFTPQEIGVIYDLANMTSEGYEQYRMGMELLGPYMLHMHIGNGYPVKKGTREDGSANWQWTSSDLAEGITDYAQVLADLKAVRYDGFMSLEDYRPLEPKGREDMLARNLRYLKSLE